MTQQDYDEFQFEISDIASEKIWYNFLLYADSGAGKTVFAGSDRRVLFIAPERHGVLSAARMGSKAHQVKIKHWDHFRKSIDHLEAHPEILENYDWLCIDSLSEMEKMLKRAILEEERGIRLSKDQDPDTLQIQDYGKAYTLMENVVYACNDLPINTLYTALSAVKESPDGKEFLVPMLGSSDKKKYELPMKIVAMMTSYGHLRVEDVEKPNPTEENPEGVKMVRERRIYWDDTGKIRAKDRTTRLGPFTTNATLQKVRRCADGNLVRAADGTIVAPKSSRPAAAKPTPEVKIEDVKTSPQADDQVKSKAVDAPAAAPTEDSKEESKQLESVEA